MTGVLPKIEETVDRLASEILERGRQVVETEADGLFRLGETIGAGFIVAAKALLNLAGRAIVSGMGKSGHIAGKIAACLPRRARQPFSFMRRKPPTAIWA